MTAKPVPAQVESSWLTPQDLYLFNEGSHVRLYEKMGAQPVVRDGKAGYHFAVWAPNAEYVSVIGDFNGWHSGKNPLQPLGSSGVWGGFIPGVHRGNCYKYHISSRHMGYKVEKGDPYAFTTELPPKSASVAWDLAYDWNDQGWMASRGPKFKQNAPVSIYEVHLGSWMRNSNDAYRSYGYREVASKLADYCKQMGFTHVEFLPLTQHPFFGSWGYQVTGYFAADSRYGTPQDLMYLIDHLHQNGIGVILDWVPSHFATDEHGLGYFDGTHLYEHSDQRQGYHPDWGSYVFNYGRNEVRSFLLSSALFWLDKYHIDGLRVDAVASMLYLDYSRKQGEWIPNRYGGKENIDAIEFLRRFNAEVYGHFPDVQTIAEESTAWPMVSRPTYIGGLGFGYKWDMGWMHDSLSYVQKDPVHRKYHQNDLTFRMLYAFTENYILPLSHDEVVHGKGSIWNKIAGDDWQKNACQRALYAYMFGMPGKKLLFMGDEIGQRSEWRHDGTPDWHVLEYPHHKGVQTLVADLNRLYRDEPALHELDTESSGFEWVDANDSTNSVFVFMRKPASGPDRIVCVLNFTPVVRTGYRIGLPGPGYWREILNSDAELYAGSNVGNSGGLHAEYQPYNGQPYSALITLPPMAAVFFKGQV